MKLWKTLLIASAGLVAGSNFAFADDSQPAEVQEAREPVYIAPATKSPQYTPPPKEWAKFFPFEITVMGGIATLDGDDVSVVRTEYETDALEGSNDNNWNAGTVRVGIGYKQPLYDHNNSTDFLWFPSISPELNYYYLSGHTNGEVYRFESAHWNQESYEMDLTSSRLMLDLSLTLFSSQYFSVYGLAGVGIAWNSLDFEATAHSDLDCPITPLALKSENSSSFAYEAGAGLSISPMKQTTISLEYLFSVLTDVGVGEAIPYGLDNDSETDLRSQAIMLGLRVAL